MESAIFNKMLSPLLGDGKWRIPNKFHQLKILIWKNFLLDKNRKIIICFEVMLPFFCACLLIVLRIADKTPVLDPMRDLNTAFTNLNPFQSKSFLLKNSRILLYHSNNESVAKTLMQGMENMTGIYSKYMANVLNLMTDLTNSSIKNTTVGLIFHFTNHNVNYEIRMSMNYDYFSLQSLFPFTYQYNVILGSKKDEKFKRFKEIYLYLLNIQSLTERTILGSNHEFNVSGMPTPRLRKTGITLLGSFELTFITVMCFLVTLRSITRDVIHEKDSGLRETLILCGVSGWLQYFSWFLKYQLILLSYVISFGFVLGINYGSERTFLGTVDPSIILCFLVLSSFYVIFFSFAMASFSSEGVIGANLAAIILIFSLALSFFFQRYSGTFIGNNIYILFPFTCFNSFYQTLNQYDNAGLPLAKGRLFDHLTMDENGLPLGFIFILMIIHMLLFILVTWYFNNVFSGKLGNGQSWNFLLKVSFWKVRKYSVTEVTYMSNHEVSMCMPLMPRLMPLESNSILCSSSIENGDQYKLCDTPKKSSTSLQISLAEKLTVSTSEEVESIETSTHLDNPVPQPLLGHENLYEEAPQTLPIRIILQKINKSYGTGKSKVEALQDVNLQIHSQQVTVLLGHSGSGKTCLISIISGIVQSTSGKIFLIGNAKRQRYKIGLCPQTDVLWQNLTIREHLTFFARLKLTVVASIESRVTSALTLTKLDMQSNEKVKSCSHCTCRKLSIAISLVEGAEVLLLDEPSSGLDPRSQRQMWDLLRSLRKTRTIIVSTHEIEEADAIGDRIVILSHGKIHCVGSPAFLKQGLGSGFKLRVLSKSRSDVYKMVKSHIPSAVFQSYRLVDGVLELLFFLPFDNSTGLWLLLRDLESKVAGIIEFKLEVTTLDEVFSSVGKENSGSLSIESLQEIVLKAYEIQLPFVRHVFLQQLKAVFMKKLITFLHRPGISFLCLFMPWLLFSISILLINNSWGGHIFGIRIATLSHYGKPNIVTHNAPLNFTEYLTREGGKVVPVSYDVKAYLQHLALQESPHVFLKTYLLAYEFVKDDLQYLLFHNQSPYSASVGINLYHNYLYRRTGRITFTNSPIKKWDTGRHDHKNWQNIIGSEMLFYVLCHFGIAFLASSFACDVIDDMRSRLFHLQRINGLNRHAYWMACFSFDLCVGFVVGAGIVIIYVIVDRSFISATLHVVLCLYVLYVCVTILITYFLAIYLKRSAFGYSLIITINLILGILPMFSSLLTMVVELAGAPQAKLGVSHFINQLFSVLSSPYALANGLAQLHRNWYLLHVVCEKSPAQCRCLQQATMRCPNPNYMGTTAPGVGSILIMLLIQMILGFTVLMVVIHPLRRRHRLFSTADYSDMSRNMDVANEMRKIFSVDLNMARTMYPVVFKKVRSVEKDGTAISGLTLAIGQGECFGLLGGRDSGKSMVLKLITGEVTLLSGDAFVGSFNLVTNIAKVHQIVGYCPQVEKLSGTLTCRQTLMFYARIASLKNVQPTVEKFLELFHLENAADIRISKLGKSARRKVNIACALIGAPPVILLDEPTEGLDPSTRQLIWKIIKSLKQTGTTILFTSHSWEESEEIADRLCILVDGQMQCLGTPHYLKYNFGKGFSLVFSSDDPELKLHLDIQLPTAEFQNRYQNVFTFFIPGQDVALSDLFQKLEGLSQKQIIHDYNIVPTTLEEIILSLYNKNEEKEQILESDAGDLPLSTRM